MQTNVCNFHIDILERMFYTIDCQEELNKQKTHPQTVLEHHRTGLIHNKAQNAHLYFTY